MTNNIPIAALIMTGGYNEDGLSSVEVYVPSTNTSCSLPSLPVTTWDHSQDGLLLCGGSQCSLENDGCLKGPPTRAKKCLTFYPDSGLWITTHPLQENRYGHSSWQREDGTVLLMGGRISARTTEFTTTSGLISRYRCSTRPGYRLQNITV